MITGVMCSTSPRFYTILYVQPTHTFSVEQSVRYIPISHGDISQQTEHVHCHNMISIDKPLISLVCLGDMVMHFTRLRLVKYLGNISH